jgi:phage tail-like protein
MAVQYPDPIQAFRFLIKVEGSGNISAAFTRCSGIRMEVETLEGREGWDLRGVKISTPVLTRYEPVTLSKGVVGDCDFLDWIFAASAGDYTGPSGSSLRRTIDIITLNDLGQPGVTWTLSGAMPIGYEVPQLDGSRSEVLTESLTLSYTGMKRKAEARQQPQ